METKYVWLHDWVVVDYLFRSHNKQKTKNIELLVGLMLCKFCEKQWSTKCTIGLPVMDRYEKEIPTNGMVDLAQLEDIVENKIDEATPTDIVIGRNEPETNRKGQLVSQGMSFQIKRFGKNPTAQDTEALINFITEEIPKKYPPNSGSGLIVLAETPEEIRLKEVAEKIQNTSHPFEKIIIIGLEEKRYLNFYGLWPNTGQCQFDLDTFEFNF
ncbi:MAG: hypothetical protein A3J59_04060 [Candidatus Buchananbacteria bacterium RIFCSPHIGHO2_02_FULL_56_16]|uniref:Uncharacterized protein n=1 Tax=Candidatus Buchananbacteria bacterium RIFCSPHIGHO2_02_FULL_56_16 TaxID=1797542 RepID=A0A1G1YI96_9BACT|nr:MAG: hypothetical protein A3J59_04060 [Candidatus Buchananbacteria bacterium RIFCSPHIGHO2_02_FULL_56_16]